MKEIDFDPNTMTVATSADIFRMYRIIWPKKDDKKRNGFHSKREGGYVYIIRDVDGNLKVGAAHDIQKRMKSLRLKYVTISLVATIAAFRFMFLEKFLHYELAEYHVKNEWFYSEKEENILEKISLFLINHGSIFEAEEMLFVNPAMKL